MFTGIHSKKVTGLPLKLYPLGYTWCDTLEIKKIATMIKKIIMIIIIAKQSQFTFPMIDLSSRSYIVLVEFKN